MLELLKLEQRKHKLGLPLKTIVVVLLILLATIVIERNEPLAIDLIFGSYRSTVAFIKTLCQTVIMIFAAVQIERLILREYHHKTINQLLSYPIHREMILASKILLIACWTLISMLFSTIVAICAAITLNQYMPFIRSSIPDGFFTDLAVRMLIETTSCTLMSFIPLAFGMLRKSSVTLIVSAIMISVIINSHNGEFSATELLPIQIIGSLIGISIIALFIWRSSNSDIN
jgi:ABC-type transport system involved in multi-copper enzyme maturation permease subunit